MKTSFLFALISALIFAAAEDIPGEALVSSSPSISSTLLKPQIFNPIEANTEHHNTRRIDGLLQLRALVCPSGYGSCNNPGGRCCPLGGQCCQGSGCCAAGKFCYSTGCCKNSEFGCENVSCCPKGSSCCKGGGCCSSGDYCVISSLGRKGCCPVGQVCTDGCLTVGWVGCANEDFCCPSGYTCYRDSLDIGRCRAPGAVVTAQPTTTKITQNALQSSTSIGSGASSAPTTVQSVPAPAAGYANVIVDLEDEKISYGVGWLGVTGSCSGAKAKRCNGNGDIINSTTMFYTFKASAIYLNIASSNTRYEIDIDGESFASYGDNGDSKVAQNCTYSWSTVSVSTSYHTLTLHVFGYSFSDHRRSIGDWWFELNNIVVTQPTGSTGTATASASKSTSSTSTGGDDDPDVTLPGAAVPSSSVRSGIMLAVSLFTLIVLT